MHKFAFLGLFITQLASAGYYCKSHTTGGKLEVINLDQEIIKVEKTENRSVVIFEGSLDSTQPPSSSLYTKFHYNLTDENIEPAKLVISFSPRFGRGCGRACQKSLPTLISAKLVYGETESYYACSQTSF